MKIHPSAQLICTSTVSPDQRQPAESGLSSLPEPTRRNHTLAGNVTIHGRSTKKPGGLQTCVASDRNGPGTIASSAFGIDVLSPKAGKRLFCRLCSLGDRVQPATPSNAAACEGRYWRLITHGTTREKFKKLFDIGFSIRTLYVCPPQVSIVLGCVFPGLVLRESRRGRRPRLDRSLNHWR